MQRAFDANVGVDAEMAAEKTVEDLHAKFGQLTAEWFFRRRVQKISVSDRRGMLIAPTRAWRRSGVYHLQKPDNDYDLAVMWRIEELFTA
ncbi:hypothetical protein LRP30_32545 [Bradyrhizobium sp. C-145]|uniref:hypothetical protein n=1 Tax=Bradyrhizobium sp. C-145 TaxID=574727 RepID=UPI00201B7CE7|nr:hypothetical protein [Bradyrhizobium sp. C-145]UQR61534.1 hypothetical protein LRP30_32545 [Bradyrhizobium sp. C-145]